MIADRAHPSVWSAVVSAENTSSEARFAFCGNKTFNNVASKIQSRHQLTLVDREGFRKNDSMVKRV